MSKICEIKLRNVPPIIISSKYISKISSMYYQHANIVFPNIHSLIYFVPLFHSFRSVPNSCLSHCTELHWTTLYFTAQNFYWFYVSLFPKSVPLQSTVYINHYITVTKVYSPESTDYIRQSSLQSFYILKCPRYICGHCSYILQWDEKVETMQHTCLAPFCLAPEKKT